VLRNEKNCLFRKSPSINSADLKCPLVETLSNSLDDTPYIDYPIETVCGIFWICKTLIIVPF
jgi:hypothetical protein